MPQVIEDTRHRLLHSPGRAHRSRELIGPDRRAIPNRAALRVAISLWIPLIAGAIPVALSPDCLYGDHKSPTPEGLILGTPEAIGGGCLENPRQICGNLNHGPSKQGVCTSSVVE